MPKTLSRSRQLAALHGAATALQDVGALEKKTMRSAYFWRRLSLVDVFLSNTEIGLFPRLGSGSVSRQIPRGPK